MNISLIGYGNVSYNLANALDKAGHRIISIHGRDQFKTNQLASKYKSLICDIDAPLPFNIDVAIICIKDDYIHDVSKRLVITDPLTIICHTSGSVGMNDINLNTFRKGIFYPLQTIRKDTLIDFVKVPICINGSSPEIIKLLTTLAKSISNKIYILNDLERRKAHLAAVVVNNFTNHIISEAFDYLKKEHIPIELVQPLLKETVNKLLLNPPDTSQTGPAKRNDHKTISKHIELLDRSNLEELYKLISQSIINKHNNK